MAISRKSILVDTDSYKVGMWRMYPENTRYIHSYISSRGGKWNESFYIGIQRFIRDVLLKPIYREDVLAANAFWTAHGEDFPLEGWLYIAEKYKGYLPLKIYGLDEGTMVPSNVPMVTVVNTDPNVPWLTTWVETAMLRSVWYPTTVATQVVALRQVIWDYLKKSSDDTSGFVFKLHDFGSRGTSSNESAAIGDMAFLATGAMGTDTAIGILEAAEYYDTDLTDTAFSIPASEHSIACAFGPDDEIGYVRQMLKNFQKFNIVQEFNIVAFVADAYNIYRLVDSLGEEPLKSEILEATKGGKILVVRPDSGDPVTVLPKLLRSLERSFGTTTNSKGYKLLNTVRLIWGDGINQQSVEAILRLVVDVMGFSSDNLAFGQGGAMLQGVGRDDQKFAMKASWAFIDGNGVDIFKNPVDAPDKKSLTGILDVIPKDGTIQVIKVSDLDMVGTASSKMKLRYEDGVIMNKTNFTEIRQRAAVNFQ